MIEQFESVIKINLPKVDFKNLQVPWKPYNPRKEIKRFGCSITSLDGQNSGIPDLDSLYEYNKLHGTEYSEMSFQVKTEFYKYFSFLDQIFELGRSHFLKLESGAFFPYHRDFDLDCFRLIYTWKGCQPSNLVWILENQVVPLENENWYYINTKKPHALFSFFGSEFVVFNVLHDAKALKNLIKYMHIK